MAEWDERGAEPGAEPERPAIAPWLQVLLGILCAVGFFALLFGLVYLKANVL